MAMPYQILAVNGRTIAVRTIAGESPHPAVLWLGGFHSDMTGIKATALLDWAQEKGRPYRCFDYSGHGASGGDFREFTVSRGIEEALAVLDDWRRSPVVLVGSSMGGWIALRLMQVLTQRGRNEKISGAVLIAPAPDFTERLMWSKFSNQAKAQIMKKGFCEQPSAYSDESYLITRALIEDGRRHLLLGKPYPCSCPVHIIHGTKDPDVPWELSIELMASLQGQVSLSLVKDGDHRLSKPEHLAEIIRAVEAIA